MIGYIRGEILESSCGKVLIGMGSDAHGMVGYLVSVPQGAHYEALRMGQVIELYIYPHIREDAFDLFGFNSRMEKDLFMTLLSVNGIGPKSALGILSAVDPSLLIEAIVSGDQVFLTKIPGIGKKTAERVVVELRDSVREKVDAGGFLSLTQGKSTASAAIGVTAFPGTSGFQASKEFEIFRDAKAALLTLGYREQDVQPLLKRVLEESEPRFQRAEELIQSALRQL